MFHNAVLLLLCIHVALASFFLECPLECDCEGPKAACKGGKFPPLGPQSTQLSYDYADPPLRIFSTDFVQHMDHLVSLEMSSVGLTTIEEGALGMLPLLEKLNLTNNNITVLKIGTFENCSKLASVSLENNNIQVIENGTFAPLTSLVNLSLAENALATLPGDLPLHIHQLDLEHNKITVIPTMKFDSLTTLNLCNNLISKVYQFHMKKLQSLCLGASKLFLNENLINKDNFPELASLTLQGGNLTVSHNASSKITEMVTLRSLELDSCTLEDLQLFNQPNSSLEKLRISDVIIKPITRSSRFGLPSVHSFDVSGSPALARFFLNTPPRSGTVLTELKILKMSRCNLNMFSETVLLSKAPNVEKLDLSHNPLDCTCHGLSWIPKYVREGKLALFKEENTTCAKPEHLTGVPLLTATMCPVTFPSTTGKTTTTSRSSTEDSVTKNVTTTSVTPTATSTPNVTLNQNETLTFNKESPSTTVNITEEEESIPTTLTTTSIETSTDLGEITAKSGFERSGTSVLTDTQTPAEKNSMVWLGILAGTLLVVLLVVVAVGAAIKNSRYRRLSMNERQAQNQENMIAMSHICRSHDQLI